jgi:hypothetical protein
MSEIVDAITQCEPVPGTDRTRITFTGTYGSHTFELTQSAVEGLLPGLISQAPQRGADTVAANVITPAGCQPFETRQGLCGFAFNLGERYLHIGVPPNGVEPVRKALEAIAGVYRIQAKPPVPGA